MILHLLLFLLPAMIANAMPVLVRKWKIFDIALFPQYLGQHKTLRGLIFGILGAICTLMILLSQEIHIESITILWNSVMMTSILYGFFYGICTLGADMVKSYYKRKYNIRSGEAWMPWDQIDWVLGVYCGFTLHALLLNWEDPSIPFQENFILMFLLSLLIGGSISLVSHRIGYMCHLINTKQ